MSVITDDELIALDERGHRPMAIFHCRMAIDGAERLLSFRLMSLFFRKTHETTAIKLADLRTSHHRLLFDFPTPPSKGLKDET